MLGAHIFGFDELSSLSDPATYHSYAVQIAERFQNGLFSARGIYQEHWYPTALAALYVVAIPSILVGKMASVLLAGLSAALLYGLMRELGGRRDVSFWCALIAANVYPAFLLFGSTLLKEVFIVPLVLAALIISAKMLKSFEPYLFIVFAALLGLTVTLRLMVGQTVLIAFLLSWFVAPPIPIRKRVITGALFLFILGVEILALGFGFLGSIPTQEIARPAYIEEYRFIAYSQQKTVSTGSTMNIDIFKEGAFRVAGFFYSFATVALGPFIWQARKVTHILGVAESILWLGALVPITASLWGRVQWRAALPVILFSGAWLVVVSLGSDNIGATMRYRIPAFLALTSLAPLGVAVLQSNYARFIHHHKI